MPASNSAPGAASLHESIEQLIAEAIRQSQTAHEAERMKLTDALSAALGDIERSQQALNRAADTLRAALGQTGETGTAEPGNEEPEATTPVEEPAASVLDEAPPAEEPVPVEVSATPASERGPHELDVIAHGASISNASGLQAFLRDRPEVEHAQTREFVNGELRLQLSLTSGLEMGALNSWLADHGGELVTSTDAVLEVRFGG